MIDCLIVLKLGSQLTLLGSIWTNFIELNSTKNKFNQIVKLLRESRQNNIPYEVIKYQIEKSYIDNVLSKLNNLTIASSLSCSMLENFYLNPQLSESLIIQQPRDTQPMLATTSSSLLNYKTYRKTKKQSHAEAHLSSLNDAEAFSKSSKAAVSPKSGDLPPYWEARVDHLGRVFYIDHMSRTTTWKRPKPNTNQDITNQLLNTEIEKQRLDKRYQSIRRTMSSSNENPDAIYSNKCKKMGAEQPSTSGSATTSSPSAHSDQIVNQPGAQFILREDLSALIKRNQQAKDLLKQSTTLIPILHKIRANPGLYYKKYQHNKELVRLLNTFSDPNLPFPPGWESRCESSKVFFVDHNSRSTTFIDPRLPQINNPSHITTITNLTPDRAQSKLTPTNLEQESAQAATSAAVQTAAPPPSRPSECKPKVAYSDRVVAFFQQANIFDHLKKLNVHLTAKQKDKINSIRQSGRCAYDRMSRDYQRGFHSKLRNFYRKLESKGYGQGPQKSKIVIRRDKLLDDARVKFMQLSRQELRKNKLFICFQGEEGLDYGGPAREFFYLLSRQLFNPYYGLFEYSASDMYTVQISHMSSFQEHVLEWFQFAGRVLAVALIHQYLLDAFFTRPFYKALLKDTNWTLSDLETLDPEYCQSLTWIKDNDITNILDLSFSVTDDKCGQLVEIDLKENGRNVPVTEKNKWEYIQRVVKWRVEGGVQKQTEALVKGFYEVLDAKYVQMFDARELELVLCGTYEIDISDWKKNTDYRSGYHSAHQIVQWFWQAVDRFDNEQKLKLLQFVTGTSSIPFEGFAALRGSNGLRKFCIERWGTPDALPRAHTCFNRLDLPPYTNFETLYEKLLLAIEETSGFSIQ
ncbi:E3 ubiquitin- ligase [Brachionus plicatilis]|uniref:E3 ubiquitin-protein ligase n=1 Tax=Brachionus plicatilis TaxID=10195 RepID=A0A3M7PSQ7_BRAPC|nr:E3 ubiquitin- ligase [Brachionus plicatilis]